MGFLRNCWYVAGFSEEVGDRPFCRTLLGEEIAFYRIKDGAAVALSNRCPHRFAQLHKGNVLDDALICPYHGLRFDRSGACRHVPSGEDAPPHARLKSYPVVDRHQLLWIWMGHPERADQTEIPDFSALEDVRFGWWNAAMHARANYQLVVDNLLDLSHAEFLHPLLSSEGWSARNVAKISQTPASVCIENIAENDNVLPLVAQLIPGIDPIGRTVQHERWYAPSLLHLSIEYYASNGQTIIPSGHFLTPETASTTHYFLRAGQDIAPNDPDFSASMRTGVLHVFTTEDIPTIEAQQAYLGDTDLLAAIPAILRSDAGAIRARRQLAKLIRAERELVADA